MTRYERHIPLNWEKARHGDSDERWNMQKSTQQTEKLLSRECKRKGNRGQETKTITLETKYNKFTMYMLKHEKASSYQQHQTMPHNQLPSKDIMT